MSTAAEPAAVALMVRPPVRPFWETGYTAVLVVVDALAATAATATAVALRFDDYGPSFGNTTVTSSLSTLSSLTYAVLLTVLTPMWINFSVSENEMQRIRNDVKAGRLKLPEGGFVSNGCRWWR